MTLVDLIFTAKTYRERARGSGLSRDVQFNAGQMVDFLDGVIAFLEQERPEASAPPQSRTLAIFEQAIRLYQHSPSTGDTIVGGRPDTAGHVKWCVDRAFEIMAEVEKRG